MTGPSFGMDSGGAYSVMGSMDGFAARVSTPYYINSVLRYAHGRLADFFDLWLDNEARNDPHSFMHVYEWPQRFRNYRETVGNPHWRLWVHTLQGRSASAQASFQFLPSQHPVPVDPILTTPGPGGRAVKTGVHVFVWKARVMEYGLPVEITPKLSRYLAYVISASKKGGTDSDEFRHPNMPEDEGGSVMLSRGPVNINAAGGTNTKRKFTTAFQLFYRTLSADHMKNDILPDLERDLAKTIKMQLAQDARSSVKVGKTATKGLGITAWASEDKQNFAQAKRRAEAALRRLEENYIADAARRRAKLYGG